MQQFARRQPHEPENDPPQVQTGQFEASDDMVAQWMDQLCSLQQQVASLTEEVTGIKGENQRLRAQIAAWVANQEAYLSGKPAPAPEVAPIQLEPEIESISTVEAASETEVEPQQELPTEEAVIEQVADPEVEAVEDVPHTDEPTAEEEESQIDEESFIEIARHSEPPAKEEKKTPELTDDEIQKMLAEVATGATDANEQPTEPEPVEVVAETPAEPFLHLEEEEEPEPEQKVELSFEIDRTAVNRVPSHLAISALAVPYRLDGDSVVCKAVAPFDHASLDLIADAIAAKVVPESAPIAEVVAGLRIAYSDESNATEREEVWAVSQPERKKGLFRRSG